MSETQIARVIVYDVSNKQKRLTFFVVDNGYRTLLTDILMSIKQYAVFKCLHQLPLNIGSNNFIRIPSSHLTHKTSKETHRMHTPYADTDVLQTLCADSALRSGLTKGTCS